MRYAQKFRNKLSSIRLQNKIFFTYSLLFLLMFVVIFGIATVMINRTFSKQLDEDVFELRATISKLYSHLVNKIRNEVKTKGEDNDVRDAVRRAERGGGREIPQTDFDVFECGNNNGVLVLSKRKDDPRIGSKVVEKVNEKTDDSFNKAEDTIRERIIDTDEEPQLVVEVTHWLDWGFVTGGRSLQKWLGVELLSQPSEHPIFLVKRKDEQEQWIPLNNAAFHTPPLKEEWEQKRQTYLEEGKPIEELVVTLKKDNQQSENDAASDNALYTSTFTVIRADILSTSYADTNQLPFVELIIAYSHQYRIQWQNQTRMILLWSIGVCAVLVYCISYLISRRITRPIAQLQKGVNEIGAGNLTYQIAVQSKGEVGELADGFNRMALALKQSLEEHKAAERIAVWRDVARQLAHEVKNPLFPIRLSVENLQAAKDQPEIFENIFNECTDTIIEEVDRIRELIDEFHQYARLPVPDRHPVNLNDIVDAVLKLYMELSQAQNIKIQKQVSPLPNLSLDREQMERAVGNLVKNAIEAMPNGGTLILSTHVTPLANKKTVLNAEPDNQEKNMTEQNRTISLEVQDTGHGMSDETQQKLFAPDYTTKTYGTGLGMAIVRRIITVHGGEIDVESQENVGTTIRLTFNEATYLKETNIGLISTET